MMRVTGRVQNLTDVSLLAIGFALIGTLTNAEGDTLTGIVKQPEAPYSPAVSSTVIVVDKQTNKTVAGPDTTDGEGRYRYDKIRKGAQLIVKATWKSELSSPGITEAKMVGNPTNADVQLLPAKTASADEWKVAGMGTAITRYSRLSPLVQSLSQVGVPSGSIYSFIVGTRQGNPRAYNALNKIGLFTTSSPDAVTAAIKIAEADYKDKATIPTYQALSSKVNGLTEAQYIGALGFVGTSNAYKNDEEWKGTLIRFLGTENQERVFGESIKIDTALQEPHEAYKAANPGSRKVFKPFW